MIPSPLLVVTDRHRSARPLVETVRALIEGGARWIWFRDKDLEVAARHDLALRLLAIVRRSGGRLSIGGDLDLAKRIGADGVHLRSSAEAAEIIHARQGLGEGCLVGISAHSLGDVRRAASAGADYVTLSPIFATASKPGYGPALGLAALRAAAENGLPVIALGGIGPDEAGACRDAGASGVAVMGGLMRASDPAGQARRILQAMLPAT